MIKRIEDKLNCGNDLSLRMKSPIIFMPPIGGLRGYGYEATTLIDICELILKARDKGALLGSQERYAAAAEIVIRAFAKVGIIAVAVSDSVWHVESRLKLDSSKATILEREWFKDGESARNLAAARNSKWPAYEFTAVEYRRVEPETGGK
jgi:hypothetical protein